MVKTLGFIFQTSYDYDLPYQQVKKVYDNCKGDLTKFYSDLESIINEQSK